MVRLARIFSTVLVAATGFSSAQPSVRVEPAHLEGPRQLQEQTRATVIRDYLQAWESIGTALEQNRADLLDRDFVGTARDRLADTIEQQSALGIHTRYQDRSHDLQIVFYSPDGLSIQLTDNVDYDVQVLDRDKVQATQHIREHYIAVLTPTEVRWRVRVLQAQPE